MTGVCSARNVELIFDAVGNRSLRGLRRVLRPTGTLVLAGAQKGRWIRPLAPTLKAVVMSRFVRQRLAPFIAQHSKDDLLTLKEMIEAGKVMPVIDRTYPLSEVLEAIGYLEAGHTRGKVVISV